MHDIFTLFLHTIVTIIRLAQPGGLRAVVAESVLMRTSSSDSESGPQAGSQPSVVRSHHRRFVHSTNAAIACFALGHRLKDLDSARCGRWIYFEADRGCYKRTGFWLSWINLHDESWGFAVHRGVVDGVALCRMFNRTIHGQILPKYLSSDHDPLYRYHQWEAN